MNTIQPMSVDQLVFSGMNTSTFQGTLAPNSEPSISPFIKHLAVAGIILLALLIVHFITARRKAKQGHYFTD